MIHFFLFQDILSQSTVALHIEVRPRYLIPDTNCFVDDLISIKAIASAHPLYQLMIPITGKFQRLLAALLSFRCMTRRDVVRDFTSFSKRSAASCCLQHCLSIMSSSLYSIIVIIPSASTRLHAP